MDQVPAKKVLTKQQKMSLVVVGVLAVIGIAIAVVVRGQDAAIDKNGVEVSAVSTGQYMQTRDGGRRSKVAYKAQYSYEVQGRKYFVYGEKLYKTAEEIVEGATVTVKYLPNEVTKSIVTSGE